MIPSTRLLASAALPAALVSIALGIGCGGGASNDASKKVTEAKFDPAAFGDPATGANPYLPLKPGTQWVREGAT